MTKDEWKKCREQADWKYGDMVNVTTHWNYGRPIQRLRTRQGRLDYIDESGIFLNWKRISYKSLEHITKVKGYERSRQGALSSENNKGAVQRCNGTSRLGF